VTFSEKSVEEMVGSEQPLGCRRGFRDFISFGGPERAGIRRRYVTPCVD
jgi:hypothetical protein